MAGFPSNGTIIDNFDRADASPISGSWAQGPLFFGANDVLRIVSNQCAPHATPTTAGNGYYNGATFGPDIDLFCTIATKGTSFMELLYRLQQIGAGTSDGYYINADPSVNELNVSIVTNGSPSTIGAAFSQTIANGDSFGVRCTGSTHEVWYKTAAGSWTSLGTRTDATYSPTGNVGFAFSDSAWRIDNLSGGTYLAKTGVGTQGP